MTKSWRILIVLFASAALTWAAVGLALEVPKLQGRVNDHANLLQPAQRAQLESRLAAYEESSGNQFVLLTVRSLEGDPIEDFSIRIAEAWKLGSKQEDNGLILLVALEDRQMRVEVGYGLEGNIPDVIASRIIRNVLTPAFRQGDYYGGINQAFGALMKAASGEAVPEAAGPVRRGRESQPANPWVTGFSLLVTLLVLSMSWLSPGRRRRFGYYGGMGGGHFGGRGGFGGGGFGGGGGGFGGGGASGNW